MNSINFQNLIVKCFCHFFDLHVRIYDIANSSLCKTYHVNNLSVLFLGLFFQKFSPLFKDLKMNLFEKKQFSYFTISSIYITSKLYHH